MGHYDGARERRRAEKQRQEKKNIREHVRKEVEDMNLSELRAVKKVVDKPSRYKTLFSFLNTSEF